jgi:hypothetical protein
VQESVLKKLASDMINDNDLRAKFAMAYKVAIPVREGSRFYANGREVENIQFSKAFTPAIYPTVATCASEPMVA